MHRNLWLLLVGVFMMAVPRALDYCSRVDTAWSLFRWLAKHRPKPGSVAGSVLAGAGDRLGRFAAAADQVLAGRAGRSAQMIADKAAEEKLRALEAKNPTVIEVEPEGETLQAVIPPPEPPEIFNPGGRGR